jgi:hypothetical protein
MDNMTFGTDQYVPQLISPYDLDPYENFNRLPIDKCGNCRKNCKEINKASKIVGSHDIIGLPIDSDVHMHMLEKKRETEKKIKKLKKINKINNFREIENFYSTMKNSMKNSYDSAMSDVISMTRFEMLIIMVFVFIMIIFIAIFIKMGSIMDLMLISSGRLSS